MRKHGERILYLFSSYPPNWHLLAPFVGDSLLSIALRLRTLCEISCEKDFRTRWLRPNNWHEIDFRFLVYAMSLMREVNALNHEISFCH
jgi:hypothetical protein